ncbi:MAG: hypothetical protein LIP23_04495 [Planctomycetes bacterium]|nr:hypothetical protein [Planctomycetota bacterium]
MTSISVVKNRLLIISVLTFFSIVECGRSGETVFSLDGGGLVSSVSQAEQQRQNGRKALEELFLNFPQHMFHIRQTSQPAMNAEGYVEIPFALSVDQDRYEEFAAKLDSVMQQAGIPRIDVDDAKIHFYGFERRDKTGPWVVRNRGSKTEKIGPTAYDFSWVIDSDGNVVRFLRQEWLKRQAEAGFQPHGIIAVNTSFPEFDDQVNAMVRYPDSRWRCYMLPEDLMNELHKRNMPIRLRLRLVGTDGQTLGYLPSIQQFTLMKSISAYNQGSLFNSQFNWFIVPHMLINPSQDQFKPGVQEVEIVYLAKIPDEILAKLATVEFSMEKYIGAGSALFVEYTRTYEMIDGIKVPVVLEEKDVLVAP